MEKGVDVLVRAMDGVDAELIVVGDGPDEQLVRSLAPSNVTFAGHVPRDELPPLYRNADVFVMPSRSETWGMAMQEAAAVGLPLIATDAPGAAHDLIEDGVNGYRVPAEDVAALHDALVKAAADPAWRERARARTLELARGYTPEAWAEAVANLAVKTLRTICCGLIGSEAVAFLDERGWTVHGVDNNMRRDFFGADGDTTWNLERLQSVTQSFTHHDLDVRDRPAWSELGSRSVKPDLIVHCAAQPSHDLASEPPVRRLRRQRRRAR